MGLMYSVSKVNPKTLRATIHYASDNKTFCGKKVGDLAQKWFAPLPWESPDKYGTATCEKCRAALSEQLAVVDAVIDELVAEGC